MPRAAKWLIGGGVGYLLLPVDLIPDFIPIIGQVDDVLIGAALIGLGMKLVPARVKGEDRARTQRIYGLGADRAAGRVLFQKEALAGSFGVRIHCYGHSAEKLASLAFLLLDLMYEYRLAAVAGMNLSGERFERYAVRTATNDAMELPNVQTQLDVNLRPLPLIAAVMYCGSGSVVRFVDTQAVFTALPPALKRRLLELRLRWLPCPELALDVVLNADGESAPPRDAAHVVTGAQFLNLLMDGKCRIVRPSDACAEELLTELREYAMQEMFCCAHLPSAGELIAWDPRVVYRISSASAMANPRFVYPARVSRSILFH